MIVVAQLPDGASKERTDAVLAKIHDIAAKVPGVEHVVTVSGISILDNRASLANAGVAFVVLKDWDVRLKETGQDQESIQRRINGGLQIDPRSLLLRRAAAADSGRRQRRRVHDAGRDPQRRFRLRPSAEPRQHGGGGRQCAIGPPAAGHDLPRRRAAILGRGRPHQGRGARDHRRPGFRRAIRLCRLELCGAVQQVRPRLPDLHPGERGQARLGRRHAQSQGQGRQRNHDADRHGGDGQRSDGPAADQPLQSLPDGDRRRLAGAGLQLGPGARHHGSGRRSGAPQGDGLQLDRHVLPGEGRSAPRSITSSASRS